MSLVRPRALVPLTASLFAAAFFCALVAHSSPTSPHAPITTISLSTDEHVESPGWWPTKSAASLTKFVGSAECAKCHTQIAVTQATTPMAQAAAPAANSEILKSHSDLTDQRAEYHYDLSTSPQSVNFSVSDGAQSISAPIAWAFGLGHKGQTYIYQRDGGFYESHLSFYKSLGALDLTTGHDDTDPDDLKSAMGRWLDGDEARRCFGCHTTASNVGGHFDTSHLTPGVQCESCHGPGANHVAAMKSGKIEAGRAAIFNPKKLDAAASVDFCGACHRTWADVILGENKLRSMMNVRFQPYRLEDSKCWRNSQGELPPRLRLLPQPPRTAESKRIVLRRKMPHLPFAATAHGWRANAAVRRSRAGRRESLFSGRCRHHASGNCRGAASVRPLAFTSEDDHEDRSDRRGFRSEVRAEDLPAGEDQLHHLPHAPNRSPQRPRNLLRSPDPHRPPRLSLPDVTPLRSTGSTPATRLTFVIPTAASRFFSPRSPRTCRLAQSEGPWRDLHSSTLTGSLSGEFWGRNFGILGTEFWGQTERFLGNFGDRRNVSFIEAAIYQSPCTSAQEKRCAAHSNRPFTRSNSPTQLSVDIR